VSQFDPGRGYMSKIKHKYVPGIDWDGADNFLHHRRVSKRKRRRFNVHQSMKRGGRGLRRALARDIAITDSGGKIIGIVSGKNRMSPKKLGPTTPRLNRMVPKNEREDDSILGFGIRKVFDRKSIFCGLPSLNTVASYVEVVVDHAHLIPSPRDSKWVAGAKWGALAWRAIRTINLTRGKVLDRADLKAIDFGESREVISNLLDEVMEPDEVFKPQTRAAFTPPFHLFRYPIGDGYMYWVMEQDSELVEKILVTKDVEKNDILELLWNKLGRIIQLEADDEGLNYVKTELTQKKIFGSTNKLIARLQTDYQYFKENKLSRGYLLIGNPGTGKTGIVNSIVDKADGRVFIISGLDSPGTIEEMTSLFIEMQPDFIIFDDCDRSQSSPIFIKVVLKMLETVKERNPHTNFLFTANTFSGILFDDAVTRKGRIDQIYEVPEPKDEDRKEIFEKYAQEMNITLSEEDLEKCVVSSEGMTGADIKELCIQLQRATIDEVFERAQEIEALKEKYSGDNFDDDFLEGGVSRRLGLAALAALKRSRR
jgi:hypothetical protein